MFVLLIPGIGVIHAYPITSPITFVKQSDVEHGHVAPFGFTLIGRDLHTPIAAGVAAKGLAIAKFHPLRLSTLFLTVTDITLKGFSFFA